LIAETRAALCPEGDPQATRLLLLARQLWTSAGVPYHAARVRLQLARIFLAAGDRSGANAEIVAAGQAAGRIASRRLGEMASALDPKRPAAAEPSLGPVPD
jgi:hypothetical protein